MPIKKSIKQGTMNLTDLIFGGLIFFRIQYSEIISVHATIKLSSTQTKSNQKICLREFDCIQTNQTFSNSAQHTGNQVF